MPFFHRVMQIIIIFNCDNSHLKCNWFILSALLLELLSSVYCLTSEKNKNDTRYLYLHEKFANESCKIHQKVILNY